MSQISQTVAMQSCNYVMWGGENFPTKFILAQFSKKLFHIISKSFQSCIFYVYIFEGGEM